MTYAVFGIAYLLGLATFFLLSFFNFYHLIRFGLWSHFPVVMTVLYFVAVGAILLATTGLLGHVDWGAPIDVTLPSFSPSDIVPNVDLPNIELQKFNP